MRIQNFLAFFCTLGAAMVVAAQADEGNAPVTNELAGLVGTYLPGFTFREVAPREGQGNFPHYDLLRPTGQPVTNLHEQDLKGLLVKPNEGYEYYRGNPTLTTLLRDRKTRISSATEAVAVAKLILGLGIAPWALGGAWKLEAEPIAEGWLIRRKYIAPAHNLARYNHLEIVVDADRQFVELRLRE